MTNCKNLELAREWAEEIADSRQVTIRADALAAAKVITALPDEWVDADTLRKLVEDWREGLTTAPRGNYGSEILDDLESLLPAPPAPRTMDEIEWDDTEHRFAGAETENGYELVMLERRWVEGHPDLYVILCVDLEGSVGTWIPRHITPTGRKYRLEPEDDTPTSPIEDEPAPESAAPRPEDVPEFDPAYLYRDKDGDTWEFLNHNWRCSDYGREATNYLTPPAKYRPYARVEA